MKTRAGGAAPNIHLDLTGLQNPEAILGFAAAATMWHAGDTARVLSDDACFANDFLRWCAGSQLDIVSLRYRTTGQTELTVRVPRAGRA